MNADDDPNWEREAKWADFRERWDVVHRKIQKSHALDVTNLPPGTRLVVTTFEEEDDPLATGPIEFTMLDPLSGKVLVKDRRNFTEPTEATLVGSEDVGPIFLPGKLKRLCWLVYQVGGKRFDRNAIWNTIRRIEIYKPGTTEPLFVLWEDD